MWDVTQGPVHWSLVAIQISIFKGFYIRSTPLSWPNKASISVRPSTESFSDSNEIWCVGRCRWVMHDGMPYGLIQGQGHVVLKVRNSSIFKIYLLHHFPWELANDCQFLNYKTISKFTRARFLISVLVFTSHNFELRRKLRCDLWNILASDLIEIWYVGKGRWVMHDGMPYGPI